MATSDVLVLGASGAGKTALVHALASTVPASSASPRRLETAATVRKLLQRGRLRLPPAHAATSPSQTGVELDYIPLPPTRAGSGAAAAGAGAAASIQLREVGAAMRAMWGSYLRGAKTLMVRYCKWRA